MLADQPDTLRVLKVMGLPVHWRPNYADWLLRQYRQGQGAHVVTLNAEMAMQADSNPALRQIILAADLVIPDGAGVVLYFQIQGRRMERMPGIELAAQVLQGLAPQETAFFFGGAPGVTDHAALYWRRQNSDINIVGTQHGFLSAEDEPAFLQRLETLQPSVIWWGWGAPPGGLDSRPSPPVPQQPLDWGGRQLRHLGRGQNPRPGMDGQKPPGMALSPVSRTLALAANAGVAQVCLAIAHLLGPLGIVCRQAQIFAHGFRGQQGEGFS